MARNSNTFVSPQATADGEQDVVAQAELVLAVLSRRAAAARVEAECAELEVLLAEARKGKTRPLRHWLSQHQRHSVADWAAQQDRIRSRSADGGQDQPQRPEVGWQAYAAHAERRLQALQAEKNLSLQQLARWSLRLPPTEPATKLSQAAKPERAATVAPRLDVQAVATQLDQLDSRLRFSRRRGLVASLLAHMLLLVGLALVTLKMPSPPSSLALESAPAEMATEMLEIAEPIEATAPEEPNEAMPPPTSLDVSQALANATATARPTALDSWSVTTASATSVAQLAAAAQGTPAPPTTNASFFGAAASGNCFCYVIDGSGSMRGGPWTAAKHELLRSLASLKPKQRFYIIFYNHSISAIPRPAEREPAPSALYATPENLEHARRWLETLKINVGAPPNDALKMAIETEPDAVYLLTDGVTRVDVAEFLRRVNRIDDFLVGEQVRVPIHCIAFYSLEGQELLQQIARENSGQFVYVPDPGR